MQHEVSQLVKVNARWELREQRCVLGLRLELVEEQEKGLLSDDETVTYIPVGADSPISGLQSLTNDR